MNVPFILRRVSGKPKRRYLAQLFLNALERHVPLEYCSGIAGTVVAEFLDPSATVFECELNAIPQSVGTVCTCPLLTSLEGLPADERALVLRTLEQRYRPSFDPKTAVHFGGLGVLKTHERYGFGRLLVTAAYTAAKFDRTPLIVGQVSADTLAFHTKTLPWNVLAGPLPIAPGLAELKYWLAIELST